MLLFNILKKFSKILVGGGILLIHIPDLFSSQSLKKHFTFFPSYIVLFYLRDFEEIKFIRNLNYLGGVFLFAKKRKI